MKKRIQIAALISAVLMLCGSGCSSDPLKVESDVKESLSSKSEERKSSEEASKKTESETPRSSVETKSSSKQESDNQSENSSFDESGSPSSKESSVSLESSPSVPVSSVLSPSAFSKSSEVSSGGTSASTFESTPSESKSEEPMFDPMDFTDYHYEFDADLSEYEMYMNPVGNEYLLLVNSQYTLNSGDVPTDMIDVKSTRQDGRDPAKLRLYAAKALEALFLEAEKDGMLYKNKVWDSTGSYYDYYVLSVTTAYRNYAWQKELYESAVKKKMDQGLTREEAEKAVTTTAKPGASEHQTGLCVDMHNFASASSTNGMREQFAACEAGKWLQENCYKFGFILRYPEDKTEQTGIGYESWHFRYVGRFHATRMHELGMCLEEYAAYLESYGYTVNEW